MKTGRYNLKDLLLHQDVEQFIIPELQRDYVWQEEQVTKLLDSVLVKFDAKKRDEENIDIIYQGEKYQDEMVLNHLKKEFQILKHKQKFGFIYAYHDKEFPGHFFLIDGQQRLTTFYLFLLAIYSSLDATYKDRFKSQYFLECRPKLDYKVRESAHTFLSLFLIDELNGESFKNNKDYFEYEYKNDVTVNNIINNYAFLKSRIDEVSQSIDLVELLDYIENFIEFNYFDTNFSEQGEKLYIYMNSRGFKLSQQEILRAKLLEKCKTSEEKIRAGEQWEELQDYFFENRYSYPDADNGFEVFLFYATIIRKWSYGELNKESKLVDSSQNLQKYLDVTYLYKVFQCLKRVVDIDSSYKLYREDYFNENTNKFTAKLVFRYLPVVYYLLKFKEIDKFVDDDLEVFRLFVLNLSHTREVANKPTEELLKILSFIDKIQSSKLIENREIFEEFYSKHEFAKLQLLENEKSLDKDELKTFLSNLYFDYKLNTLIEGNTSVIFNLESKMRLEANLYIFNLKEIVSVINKIFFADINGEPLDAFNKSNGLRRYLLTYLDFKSQYGTVYYGQPKYNLIQDDRAWFSVICNHENFIDVVNDWIVNGYNKTSDNFENRKMLIKDDDWRYYFVNYNSVLKKCAKKNFMWKSLTKKIFLLSGEKPTSSDIYLICKLFSETYTEFKTYNSDICYTDITVCEGRIKTYFDEMPRLAIDIKFNDENWEVFVFGKGYEAKDLIVLENDGWIKNEEGKYRQIESFYIVDDKLSLIENNEKLYKKVSQLKENLLIRGLIPQLNMQS